jgi:DNA-binding response OmpR family regulator
MVTVRAASEDRLAGEMCGADAYMAKPVSVEKLIARVKELLGTRKEGSRENAAPGQTPLI